MDFQDIHHEHARLTEQLAQLSADVRTIRDDGVFDPERFRAVHRFINEVALPHLKDEEENIFPRALAAGLPPEVLAHLKRDHEELRALARRAMHSGLDGDSPVLRLDAVLVVERLIRAFDEHARLEESLFSDLERSLGCCRAKLTALQ
jgi:hemerythrin-like domain-containing protein